MADERTPMSRTRLALGALATAVLCGLPAQAAAHQPPKGVAWYVKRLANRTLVSTGTPAEQLVQRVECQARSYPRYVCRGTFADGSQVQWGRVTLTDAGDLRVGADAVL
jgi:hypothetical protein